MTRKRASTISDSVICSTAVGFWLVVTIGFIGLYPLSVVHHNIQSIKHAPLILPSETFFANPSLCWCIRSKIKKKIIVYCFLHVQFPPLFTQIRLCFCTNNNPQSPLLRLSLLTECYNYSRVAETLLAPQARSWWGWQGWWQFEPKSTHNHER